VITTGTVVLKELPREEARVSTVVEPIFGSSVGAFAVLKAYLITYLSSYLTRTWAPASESVRLNVPDRYVGVFCERVPQSVVAGHARTSRPKG
jgi:hypothetical protein